MSLPNAFLPSEVNTWRAVTGGAYNIRGIYGPTMPAKGTIPFYVPLPGTISVSGKSVRGTGTTFQSSGRLAPGDFIYAVDVVRRVKDIVSDTLLELEYEFPAAVTNAPLRICKATSFLRVVARSTGAADATKLQEALFVQDDVAEFRAPVSYDATAGQISFTVND